MAISKKKIKYLFLFFPIINIYFYNQPLIKSIRILYLILIFTYLFLGITVSLIKGKKKLTFISCIVLLFIFVQSISTYLNNRDLISYWGSCLVVLISIFILEQCPKEEFYYMLDAICSLCLIYLFINALLILVNPQGFLTITNGFGWSDHIYFLGQTYNYYLLILLAYFLSFIMAHLYHKKLYIKMANVLLVLYIFYGIFMFDDRDMTSVVVLMLILVFYYLDRIHVLNKLRINSYVVMGISIVIYFTVTVTNSLLNSSIVSFIVENILHKSITFSGRTYIWTITMSNILKSPVWGYGVGAMVTRYTNSVLISEHNQILHILVEGGIISLSVFLLLIVTYCHNLIKINDQNLNNFSIVIFVLFMLTFLFYSYGMASCWSFYFFLVLCGHLIKMKSQDFVRKGTDN
ncbi:O-antigen ligase family protein [Diplocloster hominis]|uniref:O-antigen ligase family protein n=1 Tax=Diplocloster hominis TaxID=3079010 RepID=UPI0031BB9D7A